MDNLDKYKGRWLWWEDITTLFTIFITKFAVWSVCVSIDRGGKMYLENTCFSTVVDLGTNWLPIPLLILGVWLLVLIILKARGKLKNQQIVEQDRMVRLSQDKDFTKAIRELTNVLKTFKDTNGGKSKTIRMDK
ncbi:MAG: hypothetical protein ABH934_03295 [Chloroflexota bacterium]